MSQDQHTQDFAGNLSSSEIPDINNIIRPYSDADVIKPKGEFLFNDFLWKVLPASDQQNGKMMKRIFETVDQVSGLSSRFLAVRYDLHLKEFQSNNQVIDIFHKNLFAQLRKRYPKSFVSYIWVRERNEADAHHYHYALMMDGDYIRNPYNLNEIVKMCWEAAAGGTVYFPKKMAYFVKQNDVDTYSKLMIRLSYFGKNATKESSGVCKKRIGFGIRKARKTGAMSAKTYKKLEVQDSELVQAVEPKFKNVSTNVEPESALSFCGKLDKYFTHDHSLELLKPPAQPIKYDVLNRWVVWSRPDWKWHRLNYVYEALSTGVCLSEYAEKYALSLTRTYANFRQVGGQSLRTIHWAWHRRCLYFSDMSLSEYIAEKKLYSKMAVRQLQRRPMSEFWRRHFDNYYRKYWLHGYTVSYYCRVYSLNVSTARRYLVDFPNAALIDPFVLKPWL